MKALEYFSRAATFLEEKLHCCEWKPNICCKHSTGTAGLNEELQKAFSRVKAHQSIAHRKYICQQIKGKYNSRIVNFSTATVWNISVSNGRRGGGPIKKVQVTAGSSLRGNFYFHRAQLLSDRRHIQLLIKPVTLGVMGKLLLTDLIIKKTGCFMPSDTVTCSFSTWTAESVL